MAKPTSPATTAVANRDACRRHHLRAVASRLCGLALIGSSCDKPPQVVGELLGRRVAIGRILFDRLQNDRFQILRDAGVDLPRFARLVERDLRRSSWRSSPAKAG